MKKITLFNFLLSTYIYKHYFEAVFIINFFLFGVRPKISHCCLNAFEDWYFFIFLQELLKYF